MPFGVRLEFSFLAMRQLSVDGCGWGGGTKDTAIH
jgi:hypothetical protein